MKSLQVLTGGAYPFLALEDHQLLRHCRVDAYMASGCGGQKRNRTYSAVRITHPETGISVIAEESRSQHSNKLKALQRLQKMLALYIRKDTRSGPLIPDERILCLFHQDGPVHINIRNDLYPLFCATILDMLFMVQGKMSEASKLLNISTGTLNKILGKDKDLFISANQLRQHFGLKPLK